MGSQTKEPLLPAPDVFRPAGHGVSISPGTNHETTSAIPNSTAPRLILVFSWMSASPRHVRPYLTHYRTRYPDATIVHITSNMFDTTLRPESGRRRDMKPVLDAVLKEICRHPADAPPRILVHMFSNAGAYGAGLLGTMYREKTGMAFPAAALVLDSTPGRATFERLFHAFTLPFASFPAVVRAAGAVFVALGLAVVIGLQRIGVQDAVERSRRVLNDKAVIDGRASRLYLYSKADEMVLSTDVEDHSDEAEAKGMSVHRVAFEKSAHCGHVRAYEDAYWGAVDEVLSTK